MSLSTASEAYSLQDLTLFATSRLSATNAPPKDAAEFKKHLQLIQEHKRHERRMIEKEAKEVRRKREATQKDVQQWADLLKDCGVSVDYCTPQPTSSSDRSPTTSPLSALSSSLDSQMNLFAAAKTRKSTVTLWKKGLPPQVRPFVWPLALGNPLEIDARLFAMCVVKARRRHEKALLESAGVGGGVAGLLGVNVITTATAAVDGNTSSTSPVGHEASVATLAGDNSKYSGGKVAACSRPTSPLESTSPHTIGIGLDAASRDDPYSQLLGIASSVTVPEEVSLKQAFSREAYKLQRRYTNDHLVEGALGSYYNGMGLATQQSASPLLASSSSVSSNAALIGDGGGATVPSRCKNTKKASPSAVMEVCGASSEAEGGTGCGGGDASLALGRLSEDGATLVEDGVDEHEAGLRGGGNIASPRSHVKDNTNAIAIDLHRTIITRCGRTAFTTIDGASPRAAAGGGSGGGGDNVIVAVASPLSLPSLSTIRANPNDTNPFYSNESELVTIVKAERGGCYGSQEGNGREDVCITATRSGAVTPLSSPTPTSQPQHQQQKQHSQSLSGNVSFSDSAATTAVHQPSSASQQYNHLVVNNMCEDTNLLKRISDLLRVYVEYRPDIGYVQGMSYLAAMLLLHIEDDQKAFVALASLLAKGHLRYFYTVQHRGIGSHMAVFGAVFAKGLPKLHRHFQYIGIVPQMYVIDWWMSLFSRTLPYEIAARCWDLFLLDEAYLYRISMCLLIYFSNVIHDEAPIDEILMFLSKIQNYTINEDRLFSIIADSSKYPPSIDFIHKTMQEHLSGLSQE